MRLKGFVRVCDHECVMCVYVPGFCYGSSGLEKQIVYGVSVHCCSSEIPAILECPAEWRSICANKKEIQMQYNYINTQIKLVNKIVSE